MNNSMITNNYYIQYESYSDKILEPQYELVQEVTKDWVGFTYPSVSKLRKHQNCKCFSPDMQHYARIGDELRGYISTRLDCKENHGLIQIPFIKNSDEEIEDFLMERAIRKMISKNVGVISTYIEDSWEFAKGFLDRYGYERTNDVSSKGFIRYELNFLKDEITLCREPMIA